MSYKYLDYEREKELIHVLCGDYDLKSTLEFIDDMCNNAYNNGSIDGYNDGYDKGYDIGRDVLY